MHTYRGTAHKRKAKRYYYSFFFFYLTQLQINNSRPSDSQHWEKASPESLLSLA